MTQSTNFEYLSPGTRLTVHQENFIKEWWPMLAAGAWAFFLKEKKIPAMVIDEAALPEPDAARPTGLLELCFHLQEENQALDIGDLLEDFSPDKALAVLFFREDRATNFVTLATDLTPPICYALWELWQEKEHEREPERVH